MLHTKCTAEDVSGEAVLSLKAFYNVYPPSGFIIGEEYIVDLEGYDRVKRISPIQDGKEKHRRKVAVRKTHRP